MTLEERSQLGWRTLAFCLTSLRQYLIMPRGTRQDHASGHKAGVAGIYNRAIYAPEKRAALETWADYIAAHIGHADAIGPAAASRELVTLKP